MGETRRIHKPLDELSAEDSLMAPPFGSLATTLEAGLNSLAFALHLKVTLRARHWGWGGEALSYPLFQTGHPLSFLLSCQIYSFC